MAKLVLSKLYIYPIKSAGGISISQSQLTSRGLQFDRRWMVVAPNGQFMTQRQFPKMALIAVEVLSADRSSGTASDAVLRVSAPGMPALTVSHKEHEDRAGEHKAVEVWGDRAQSIDAGKDAQAWFTRFLQTPCQLVYMPESTHRPTDHGMLGANSLVSFADAYPYLLISEASLNGLNQKLSAKGEHAVTMKRFRPNLVVSGVELPHDEDQWATVKIGAAMFDLPKLCARCSIPNVNPQTGDRSKEPAQTLSTYRQWDKGIWFGQNCVQQPSSLPAQDVDTLRVGDAVEVLATRS